MAVQEKFRCFSHQLVADSQLKCDEKKKNENNMTKANATKIVLSWNIRIVLLLIFRNKCYLFVFSLLVISLLFKQKKTKLKSVRSVNKSKKNFFFV